MGGESIVAVGGSVAAAASAVLWSLSSTPRPPFSSFNTSSPACHKKYQHASKHASLNGNGCLDKSRCLTSLGCSCCAGAIARAVKKWAACCSILLLFDGLLLLLVRTLLSLRLGLALPGARLGCLGAGCALIITRSFPVTSRQAHNYWRSVSSLRAAMLKLSHIAALKATTYY